MKKKKGKNPFSRDQIKLELDNGHGFVVPSIDLGSCFAGNSSINLLGEWMEAGPGSHAQVTNLKGIHKI